MTLYTCNCGKDSKDIPKATIIYKEGHGWITKEALCSCGKYMESEPTEGMPNLIRTEPTLSKKRDILWDSAKEKLIGDRGVNEDFK